MLTAAFLFPSLAHGQAEVLVVEGDFFPGVGTVTEVVEVAIDGGGTWVATVTGDQLLANRLALVKDGAVVLKFGDALPGATPGSTFAGARALDVDGAGGYGWVTSSSPSPSSSAQQAYLGLSLLGQKGDPIVAPGVTPGTTYLGFYDIVLDDLGGAVVHAYGDDAAVQGIHDNMLLYMTPQPGRRPRCRSCPSR